jgi:hypothetical protein
MAMNKPRDTAKLISLDTGETVFISLESQGEERTFGAGIPEERIIHFALNSMAEEQIALLKKFAKTIRGQGRTHRLLYSYGTNKFRCELKSVRLEQSGVLVLREKLR